MEQNKIQVFNNTEFGNIRSMEIGKPYAEWEAEHAEKYAAMQKRRERQADA